MDMNMTGMGNSSMMYTSMTPFHTTIGSDTIWFKPWVPDSPGAVFGTCVGLFFLGAFYRFLSALRATLDLKWQYQAAQQKAILAADPCCETPPGVLQFSWKTDIPRGLLEGFTSSVGYFLMLVVMTQSVWFFIAIILGIAMGETFFGRYSARGIEKHRGC